MFDFRYRIICIAFALCIIPGAYTMDQFRFFHPLENLGSEFHSVSGIIEDSKGIIWYSTLDGLYRFNGSGLKKIPHDPENPDSLINDKIQTLFISSEGTIWAGTYGGLSSLDPETGKETLDKLLAEFAAGYTIMEEVK